MSRTVKLSQGYEAVVDDADHERVSQYRWCATVKRRTDGTARVYAVRSVRVGSGYIPEYLHRFLLGERCHGKDVDHVDGNPLNNTRSNLRVCSRAENMRNARKYSARDGVRTSSVYKGVCWKMSARKWCAKIKANGRVEHLGYFDNEEEAAMAYDAAARRHFGEFARANDIEQTLCPHRSGQEAT